MIVNVLEGRKRRPGDWVYKDFYVREDERMVNVKKRLWSMIQPDDTGSDKFVFVVHNRCIVNERDTVWVNGIRENDNIWIGRMEEYLKEDDVIVECFVIDGPDGEASKIVYAVMEGCATVSATAMLLTDKIEAKLDQGRIYGIDGKQLEPQEQLEAVTKEKNGYHRLLIDCRPRTVCRPTEEIYDEFLLQKEFWRYHRRCWLYMINDLLVMSDTLRFLLSELASRGTLNQKLSDIPSALVNSGLLFMSRIEGWILEICRVSLITAMERENLKNLDNLMDYFCLLTNVAVIDYVRSRSFNPQMSSDKSIGDIVIDMSKYLVYGGDSSPDWIDLINLYYNEFLLTPLGQDQIFDRMEHPTEYYSYINLKKQRSRNFVIFSEFIETVGDMKIEISERFGVPSNHLYVTERNTNRRLTDGDKIDRKKESYVIEIAMGVNDLKILKLLSEGSYGEIFLCVNKISDSKLVLKRQLKKTDLYTDISIYNTIGQSGLIHDFIGLYNYDGKICLGMEFYPGGSLASYIKAEQFLSEKEIAQISHQLLLQIEYLHNNGIIHGDIKSNNIVFDDQHSAKLIDFGLAKCENVSANELDREDECNNFGNSRYSAPELLFSQSSSTKIDIWSFGATLIEMITGKIPYPKLEEQPAIFKILMEKKIYFDPPQSLSTELKEFIDYCLNPTPEERASATQLIQSRFITN